MKKTNEILSKKCVIYAKKKNRFNTDDANK